MLKRFSFCVESLHQHPETIKSWADHNPTMNLMGFYSDLLNLGMGNTMPGKVIEMALEGRGATEYKSGNRGDHERRTATGTDEVRSPAASDV